MNHDDIPEQWRWAYVYECRGVHWCLETEASAVNGMTVNHHLVTLGTEEYEYDDDGNATRLDQTPHFRLIAAAPAMYAAIRRYLDLSPDCDYVDGEPEVCPGVEDAGGPCHWCELRKSIEGVEGEEPKG